METYLFKFSACLTVFWLVYILLLERQQMHHIKRFYLLGAFAISLIIPALTITHYLEPVVATNIETTQLFNPIEYAPIETRQVEERSFWNLENILYLIYASGVILFTIRFIINLVNMQRRISNNETLNNGVFIYVLLKEYRIPHSFFKYLFFNKTRFESNSIPIEVKLHEETHAKQWHSLDIVILELLQIIFWFHPLIYILKHHIKLNHEFLADEGVLNHGIEAKNYQTILLQFSSNTEKYQLSSAINYSSIKKRFTVMKTQTSKTRILVSGLLLLPIIGILVFSFAEDKYVERTPVDTSELLQLKNTTQEQASEKQMKEYQDFITNFKTTNIILNGKYDRAVIIYDSLMSQEQRQSTQKYPEQPFSISSLSKIKPKQPTVAQFESWKDVENYAIWIDNESVSNTELNKYKANDIFHYNGSKVYNNARGKKFPQPNQYHLYTKEGFEKTYKESKINNYKNVLNTYNKAIKDYLSGAFTDYSELRLLKTKADKLYNSFTIDEIKTHYILEAPELPVQKTPVNILNISIDEYSNLLVNNTISNFELLESTLKTLNIPKNYTIALKFENQSSSEMVEKTLLLIKKYNLLHVVNSSATIDQAEKATTKEVTAYNSWAKKINTALIKAESSNRKVKEYPIIKLKDITKYKEIYNKMSDLQKKNSQTWPNFPSIPPPIRPASSKVQRNSKSGPNFENPQDIYNPNFLEYIVEMEEEGASFFLDDLKITAKKAKLFAKDHTSNRTAMFTEKDKNGIYVVKLYSSEKTKMYARSIELKIINDNSYIIDGIRATKSTFLDVFNQLHQDITPEQRNNYMNIHVTSSRAISNKETWFIYNSLQDYGFYRIVTPNQEIIRTKGNTPFAIENRITKQRQQEKVTTKQVADYNAWAKKINTALAIAQANSDASAYPIIKRKDLDDNKRIYSIMSVEQKKNAESFPDFSKFPPPPRPATSFIKINGETLFCIHFVPKRYYNKSGYLVDRHGKTINGNTQVNASDVLPGQYITKVYSDDKVMASFKDNMPNNKETTIHIPSPPKPISPLDYVIDMAKKGAQFYFEGEPITSDDAIALFKTYKKLNLTTKNAKVYITK